ncbi:MAG: 6-phosphofructokinase [Firmicutes bacterium]|nr:6-phosphofructokinase [Bacillota bacterium]
MRRIAVLTSGGDAPGMNAAIRAVLRKALYHGLEVVGVRRGFQGLISGDFMEMRSRTVGDILQRGGTILKSARSEEFRTEEGREKALLQLRTYEIDALIGIGGDGTYAGLSLLGDMGMPVVGMPATIDNDIGSTEYAIGFDTACNTVIDAIDKIRDTATSHERTYVVEVMGRHAGHIALYAGLAGGAESIIIPEVDYDIREVCSRIMEGARRGKSHSIVVVAEGADLRTFGSKDGLPGGCGYRLGAQIAEITGFETRIIVLGHIQRGGTPSVRDRVLATMFGARAVDVLLSGERNVALGIWGSEIKVIPFKEALAMKRPYTAEYYDLANILSTP